MAKMEREMVRELVLLIDGDGGSVVSIQGDLDMKTIASLSDSMGIGELEKPENVRQ